MTGDFWCCWILILKASIGWILAMLISFEMLYFQILLESIGRQVEDVASDWAGRLKTLQNATVSKADRTEPPLDDDQSSPPLKPRTEEQGANKGRRQERENSSPLSLYRWYSSLSLKLSWLQTSHRTVVDNILLFRYLWSALENIAEEAASSTSFHHRLLFQFAFHLHRPLQTSDSAWDRENLLLYCYPAVPHSVPLCALLQFAKVCLISQVGFSPEHQHWLPKQQAHFSVNRFDEDKHPTTYFSSYIRHVQLLMMECD